MSEAVAVELTSKRPTKPELLPLDAGEQYRFSFDVAACIGCHSCEVACAEQNGLPAGTTWRRVGEVEGGSYPAARRFHLSMACNHCLEPACLSGCPTNAYEKLGIGVVDHHADDCIGCQYCTWTCPYSVPVLQPDRRVVTKCDMCLPRLGQGLPPACVAACPTGALSVEKVDVQAWRRGYSEADAPGLPPSSLTVSTTRIKLPPGLPLEVQAASDWNLRREPSHWPLVWLTLLTQAAAGTSLFTPSGRGRLIAAALASAALLGGQLHLGRPIAAWKALRNLRRSWLSREVALLGAYAVLALGAVALPRLALPAAAAGIAGLYASARLYMLPGKPSWDTPLTIARFAATAVALGGALSGHLPLAAGGTVAGLAATVLNWARLARRPGRAQAGAVRLELVGLWPFTLARLGLAAAGLSVAWSGSPGGAAAVLGLLAGSELLGRWLFYATALPLNVPGTFWRGAAGSDR